jgi:hypothetical protein
LFAGAAGLAEAVIAPQSAAAPAAGDLSHAALHGLSLDGLSFRAER